MTNFRCNFLKNSVYFVKKEGKSVKQKSIKTYKKKTNLKISLNNLEKIE